MRGKDLVKSMVNRFFKVYQNLDKKKIPFSRHEIVTFASLIEKETSNTEERSIISSVFYNRLKINMRLQTDPTVLYALFLEKGFHIPKNIRKKDLFHSSPYNTYMVKGLPPGPIANPGKASFYSVFYPEETDFLYFVSRNDGTHKFSKNYKEHQKAVRKYQIHYFKKIHKEQ